MILVTGATGHIGNVLVRALVAENRPVRAFVLPGDDCRPLDELNVEIVRGNVLESESLARAMVGVDTVYHLAAVLSILPGVDRAMQEVNVQGARNTARAALEAGVKRMVHASSIHAFERLPHGVRIDETTPLALKNAVGAYDRTKAEGALAVLETVSKGLNAVVVCPTGAIGPHDYLGSEMGNVIHEFSKNRPQILVDGAYDFVDVRDVTNGLLQAATHGRTGETYILSGTRISIREIKCIAQECTGVRTSQYVVPMWLAERAASIAEPIYRMTKLSPKFTRYSLRTLQDNCDFSNDKARNELGYVTRPMRETIRDFLAWRNSVNLN